MSNGHFLNGLKCQNCKHEWWEFDHCCGAPLLLVDPREIHRSGTTKVEKPNEVAMELMEMALKKLREAR